MADNDVAKLIVEIDALRAELRAALASGQGGQLGSNPSSTFSPAANALGLHQMSARGYVSALTGSNSNSFTPSTKADVIARGSSSVNMLMEFSERAINNKAFSTSDFQKSAFSSGMEGMAKDRWQDPITKRMPSWYRRLNPTMGDDISEAAMLGRPLPGNVMAARSKIELFEQRNMLHHQLRAEYNRGGKTFVGRLWKKGAGRYTRAAGVIGGIMGFAEAVGSFSSDDGRYDKRFLTDAEERSGMTKAERYGENNNWAYEIGMGSAHVAGSVLTWAAMASFTERMRTGAAMSAAKTQGRLALRALSPSHPNFNIFKATGYSLRGGLSFAGGMLRAGINPVTAGLVALNLGMLYFDPNSDLNTWGKRRDASNKKLKSQLDEMNSHDEVTAWRKIEAALNERGAREGTIMTGTRGGLSLLGLMDSPAQREDKIRERLSQDLSVAQKRAAEALVEAKLGNIDRAEKSMEKARLQAGDLVPAYWQDPLRVYTLQETASRSKACFARYLNNRTTNRSGD